MNTCSHYRYGVLFVCLGNICRSPLAKAIFEHQLAAAGLSQVRVDSCGTGHWHVGGPADARTIRVARAHGVSINHVARQLDPSRDFDEFQLIVPMDARNRADVIRAGASIDRVRLMRSFDPACCVPPELAPDVPDPYHDEHDGFELVFQMLWTCCQGLLTHVRSM